jgi:glycosyltransferase involved in cell wall biosynthesis
MKSVLLSHPHAKPDAQGVAAALSAAGRLGAFFTGVAAEPSSCFGRGLSRCRGIFPQLENRLVRGVDRSRLHSLSAVELAARALGKITRRLGRRWPSAYDCVYLAHDAAVSAASWPREIDGVYAYEDGALRTFRRALRKELPRVYDLPTPHYATVERMWHAEWKRWPEAAEARPPCEPAWKKRRKDAELDCATHVSVASSFARRSLEAVGCKLPVLVAPYGFPVETFPAKDRIADGPLTFLAVGRHSLRKGTAYLLEAWKCAGLANARLRLVGPLQLAPQLLMRYRGSFEHVPHLPRTELAAEYQKADALIFPTLCDGFGLVMQEAMCSATPVITTRCGGGPECIEHGTNGWIIPECDVDALVWQLREVAADREAAYRIGQAARARAERYTWKEAAAAFTEFLAAA